MIFKNKYFALILLLLLILLNISYCISIIKLLVLFVNLLLTDRAFAVSQISFALLDVLLSIVFIAVLIPVVLFSKNSLLNRKINWLSLVIISLTAVFLFPGMFTSESPEFYNNLKKTRLLSPFSSVYSVKTNEVRAAESLEDKFIRLKYDVIKSSDSNTKYFSVADKSADAYTKKIFLLGTDEYGRDIFTRIIYGTRISFLTGVLAVLVTLLIGIPLGFFAGYSGGIIDTILNRMSEMFLSIPMIFLIILFAAFFGSSLTAVIILLGFSGWMSLFKIVRGEIILIKRKDYFIASKNLGLSSVSLLLNEIIPVISVPIVINLVFQFGNVILAEAALSFLGLGTGNSFPSWGGMIQEGQGYIYKAWWMIVFPGVFLFVSLYVINSLGKRLNIYFNPRLQHDK